MTLDELNRRFKIVPTSLFTLPRDLTDTLPGMPVEGDCQDYAKSVKKILGLKPWQAVMIRCWSPINRILPRHAVLWVPGRGWIDSSNRQFRKSPLPNIPIWPVGTPAIVFVGWQIGIHMGWFWGVSLIDLVQSIFS